MPSALRRHWPEYLMEAAGLGLFMVSAGAFTTLLEHPGSPLRAAIDAALPRRALMGLAMGATALLLITSPWGRRSGAHINPSVTLAFWRLGRIGGADALFYVLAQFFGAAAGMGALALLLSGPLAHPWVMFAATLPGPAGGRTAVAGEAAISFFLMLSILAASSSPRSERATPVVAAALVALYITFEAPLSGMSMNPARSFGSALLAGRWDAFWIYAVVPPMAMMAAAELFVRVRGAARVHCAKLDHRGAARCIFRCGHRSLATNA
ncbi:MAG TPA: aquaporin [Candidatus Polarisedimenticolia bacterium]|nr:aquaporin [Candidatus Polarisedimenticolia bacterium]